MVWGEAGGNFLQSLEATQQQAGANEEKHRESDFHANQHAAQAMLARSGGRAGRGLVETFAQIQFCGAECGDEPEKQPGDHGNP